jgi:hypothetical protein
LIFLVASNTPANLRQGPNDSFRQFEPAALAKFDSAPGDRLVETDQPESRQKPRNFVKLLNVALTISTSLRLAFQSHDSLVHIIARN